MRIWFDTEFYDGNREIDLLSIGMVREDGREYYAENAERGGVGVWVAENVLPHFTGPAKQLGQIKKDLLEFAGDKPEFWAYYASYDWVCVCQLFGDLVSLPQHWPQFVLDVQQLCYLAGEPELPKQESQQHHALADAKWTRQAWEFLMMHR